MAKANRYSYWVTINRGAEEEDSEQSDQMLMRDLLKQIRTVILSSQGDSFVFSVVVHRRK